MRLALFLAGCLASAPLLGYERNGQVITLTVEEAGKCEAEGGCFVVTVMQITEAMYEVGKDAYKAGEASAQASCRNRT